MKRVSALLAVLATASFANAAMISYNANYGPINAATATQTIASLPLFDPGMGTLTKVTLTLDSTASGGSITWDNEAGVGSDITLGIGAEVEVTGPALLTAVAIPLQVGNGQADADNDGAADFIGTDSFGVAGGSGNDSDMDMSMAPATLAAYTGIGTFDVDLSSSVETFLSTSGGFGPIDPVPGTTEGTITITYEYIPEPTTLALLAVCGGMTIVRRRRAC